MAARDSLTLNRDSLVTQRRMLDNTIRLVGAGEVASADVARSRARTAEVEAAVETSRLAMVSAQGRLADAMGLPAGALIGLVASDTFPVAPTDVDIEALARDAVSRRSDLKSFTAFRETSRILLAAARADTRFRFDVRVKAGVAQAYFGPTFHSLGDENGVHLTNDDYVKYFNPRGIGRAFSERWEPVGSVIWNVELPFGNNQRVGRFAQALASARESDVRVGNLRRTIENTVPQIADQLRQLRTEWLQRQDAVVQYETTWDAAQRLRAAGDLTLIDTLTTEQQLTQARQQLVQAKRDYAGALARFRRETGTLVSFPEWSRAVPNLVGIVAAP
jgi:outer membrane protein TolC